MTGKRFDSRSVTEVQRNVLFLYEPGEQINNSIISIGISIGVLHA